MIAVVAGALTLLAYGLRFIIPVTKNVPLIALPNIGLYSAIAGLTAVIIGIFSLVATHTEDVNEHARVVFLTILSLVGVVVYDTGPLSSPFIALWGAVALAAPLFGVWGILPAILMAFGIPLFLAFTGHFEYTTAWYAIACAIIPVIFGFFLRPKQNASSETKEDRSYHALAKELSQATGKADVVIGAIGEGVLAVNGQGVIELINPAAVQMVGWGRDDAIGLNYKSILKLVDNKGNNIDEAKDPVARTFSSNTTTTDNSLTLVTQSGKQLLVSLQVSPLGQPGSGAIAVFRDITKEKAEEHEQAEFISTASHEMRTPVAEIEGYLGLVLNPQTAVIDDKARDFVGKAHAAAQHLGRLFQDLLDVSKAEDGRMQNNPKIVDVAKFMGDVVESLRPKAEAKGLTLTYQAAVQDAHQHGIGRIINPSFYTNVDNDHLREVADNLVENAIKYTPKGQVTVNVDGDDQHVKISVADTGLGIPREDLPHLFQKFYRVDNSQTREIGGTGLGLYLCRRLIEGMNGRIWVDSTFGQGSTFYVELPRTSSSDANRMIQEVEQESEMEAEPATSPGAEQQDSSVLPPDDLVAAVAEPMEVAASAVPVASQVPAAPIPTPPQPLVAQPAPAPVTMPQPGYQAPAQPVTVPAAPMAIAAPQPTPAPIATPPQPTAPAYVPHPVADHPNTPLAAIEQNPRAYISQTEGRSLSIPVRNG